LQLISEDDFMPPDVAASYGDHGQKTSDLTDFDYGAPAELFQSRNKRLSNTSRYKRFDTAAEAVRFAVEDIPAPALYGAYLQVDEARFGIQEIRRLYDSVAFPLERTTGAK
jgi:hypothetical protein